MVDELTITTNLKFIKLFIKESAISTTSPNIAILSAVLRGAEWDERKEWDKLPLFSTACTRHHTEHQQCFNCLQDQIGIVKTHPKNSILSNNKILYRHQPLRGKIINISVPFCETMTRWETQTSALIKERKHESRCCIIRKLDELKCHCRCCSG